MFKTKGTYCFDTLGAEHFHRFFNDYILMYGAVSVADLITDPNFLGLTDRMLVRNEEDHEEFTKISYYNVGWVDKIPMAKMFKIEEREGEFVYILNLPDYVSL